MKEGCLRTILMTTGFLAFLGGAIYIVKPFEKTVWPDFFTTSGEEYVFDAKKKLKDLGAGSVRRTLMNHLETQYGPDYVYARKDCENDNPEKCIYYWEKIKGTD